MMSGALKYAISRSSYRWPWRSESSLSKHLLNEVPPEIELSDYHRLPPSGSESPSRLLNEEGSNTESIADPDLFFERVYSYHREGGLKCSIVKWIVELLTVIFVIFFIGFFLLYVDWHYLWNAKCGILALESGNKTCDLAKEAIHQHPLIHFTLTKGIIIGSMVMLTVYGLFNFLKFIVQFRDILKIRSFYYNSLRVTDSEIRNTPWPVILDKVVRLQQTEQLWVVKNHSAHDVVMRIMRKENYLIGMVNKGILAFPIHWWVPGAGPVVNSRRHGTKDHLILTKSFEWTLNWCIFQSMFDSQFHIRRDFLANPSLLKKRLMVVGICILLMSPCLVIFMLVYLFLRHAEQFYHHPSTASSRRWSNLSKWMFREFNEVDHLFKHRMNNSMVHASNYLTQFHSPVITLIAKFIGFMSGGFAAILIIIALLDESLLEGHFFGRNLFWYAAVCGMVTAICRAIMTDELQVPDPVGAMSLVVQHTHYMPKRWRGKENTDLVRSEFETLFQYTGMLLLEEMASILLTPYLLIFVVPERVDDVLRFISDFTVDIEGVGHVCSLSVFDFESHGNSKYGSPCDAARERRSSQGKMEKSFLSFQSAYPTWEPSTLSQQFLSNLRKFREKQMHQENHAQQFNPVLSGQGEMVQRPLRDIMFSNSFIPTTGYHMGSLWSINPVQRTYPYLLDWYYISQRVHTEDVSESAPSPSNQMPFEDVWTPDNQLQIHVDNGEANWGFTSSDRLQSHLEASTSNPLFRDSVLHPPKPAQHQSLSHWWARSGPHSFGPQASFLEPPSFGHHNFSHHSDDLSDRSAEEQHYHSNDGANWSSLSRTGYVGDSDKDDGSHPPFVDAYVAPLKTLPVRIVPRSNDPV